jgi:gluconate kinase
MIIKKVCEENTKKKSQNSTTRLHVVYCSGCRRKNRNTKRNKVERNVFFPREN